MISERATRFPASPIRKLNPLADKAKQEGVKVYHVNIGQPDILTPEEFFRGMDESEIDVLSYSPSEGIDDVLQALKGYYNDSGITLEDGELMITVGGSEAGHFAFYIGLDPGQEILIPEPFYTNYRGFARLSGAEIKPIPSSPEDGFSLPARSVIEDMVTDRTGAVLLTNPSNPTGRVYTEEELNTVREIVLEYDLFFISDEVYREFVYGDAEARSVFDLDGLEEHGVMIDSISKRLSACGARIGVIASHNSQFMNAALRLGQSRLSPPTMGQLGLLNYLESGDYPREIEEMVDRYRERRDVLVAELGKIPGLKFSRPQGAFYLMVDLPVENSEDFVRWMLEDFRDNGETVMMAPAEGFYYTSGKGKSEVRLSYVLNRCSLERVAELIGMGLEKYNG